VFNFIVIPFVKKSSEFPGLLHGGKHISTFTPIVDPVFGELIVAQAQHKMTETPVRTKWLCRPVGYDNEPIYLKYMGLGPSELKNLKDQG
jgi:hypothetical protein